MNEKLLDILVCPNCVVSLQEKHDSLLCPHCQRIFPLEQEIIHFVRDEERPARSRNLADHPLINDPELYQRNADGNDTRYARDVRVREYVDFVTAHGGFIVDLATGPGGGCIAPILKRMSSESLLIATDACLPVIKFQYKLFKPTYRNRFEMLDVDLGKKLPFKSHTVDIFCGVLITNISDVSNTLQEVVRCLSPAGKMVIREIFYAQESATTRHLFERGHIFASFESFEDYCEQIGLQVTEFQKLDVRKGKIQPEDGLPIAENDEWFWCHIYLEPIEEKRRMKRP